MADPFPEAWRVIAEKKEIMSKYDQPTALLADSVKVVIQLEHCGPNFPEVSAS